MGEKLMFKMNRKGFMVKFLVSLLLGLIVFAPACMIASNIFRTSDQAKENYADFVQEIANFAAESFVGERSSEILIMDEETAIVYFENGISEVDVVIDYPFPETDLTMFFEKPSACGDSGNCICLFRSVQSERDDFYQTEGSDTLVTTVIKAERVLCEDLSFPLEIDSCAVGDPENVNSVSCEGGFVIERNLAEATELVLAYDEDNRRRVIYLTRTDNAVVLTDSKAPDNLD